MGKRKIFIVLLVLFSAVSCKKEAGPQGPQGPAGNANVKSTEATVISSDWVASGTGWISEIPYEEITQDIVYRGIVKVFIKYGTEWWAMPDVNGNNITQYGFDLGKVVLLNQDMDGSSAINPGVQTFKIVVISADGMSKNPNVNWNNYKEIEKTLKL